MTQIWRIILPSDTSLSSGLAHPLRCTGTFYPTSEIITFRQESTLTSTESGNTFLKRRAQVACKLPPRLGEAFFTRAAEDIELSAPICNQAQLRQLSSPHQVACGTNPTCDNRTQALKRSSTVVIRNSRCSQCRITVMVASKIPCTRIVVSSTAILRRLNHSVTTTTNLSSRDRSQERCSGRESDRLNVDSVIIYLGSKSSSFQTRRLSRTQ